MNEYRRAIDKAYSNYSAKVSQIAQKARKEILIPWLEEMGYNFVSGNGTYLVYDPKKDILQQSVNFLPDMLPDRIRLILELEVEDVNSVLGLWMLDYKSGG